MEIDSKIVLAKELIAKREEIDHQLGELFGGALPMKKARTCKLCGASDHDARSCPQAIKPADTSKLI
jgi:hypothetical protein